VIGDGTGPVVEPMFAEPNTFVGTPRRSGLKPAWVICTVSSAWAAVAANKKAQQTKAAMGILALGIIALSLDKRRTWRRLPSILEHLTGKDRALFRAESRLAAHSHALKSPSRLRLAGGA
jgi:hypothetical protein